MKIKKRMIIIFIATMIEGCAGMRPAPPADPNQTIIMMAQQRSLERMMNEWATRPQEGDLEKCRDKVGDLEKLLREAISRPCVCPAAEPDNFQG